MHTTCQAAKIYIKNWSSSVVIITDLVPEADNGTKTALQKSTITIQPGHEQHLLIAVDDSSLDNFSQFTMTYTTQGHTETETVYFPSSATAHTSFYFTESGYDRFPYSIRHIIELEV
jgi:hypothetical protein